MAQSDWTILNGSSDTSLVLRGVTGGIPRPNGGGGFVYGFASLTVTPSSVAFCCTQDNYAPMARGGSIRGALCRGQGGGPLGFSAYLFLAGQGTSISDQGYLLGLQDDDPSRIALRKGRLDVGIPTGLPGVGGLLARGNVPAAIGDWVHVRLDAEVNPNGDVVLTSYFSDLSKHPVTAPVWQPVPGIAQIIDDPLRVNTGSAPFTSGRAGYGFRSADISRRAYFDHLEVHRQL